MKPYNPGEIERKWQQAWEKEKIYSPSLDTAKKPFYNLMMFPYPSAEGMHVGNMYAFTGADVYGRFQRMRGNDVFEPIGLDGFGIHSENYAIKVGKHPAEQAKISEEKFYRQLRSIGNSYDWTRTVETYKPEYYKWTQWLFIQLFKAGLAYKKKAPVNFCPKDLTVLADEQVIDGKCERCGSVVEKRELEQWFFKITDYAEKLLNNISGLDWSEKVKVAQRNWIGKSEGARIKFGLVGIPGQEDGKHSVEVFTTRPDTLYGATFLAVSPELGNKWVNVGWKAPIEVKEYIETALKKRGNKNLKADEEKTGVLSQIYAINPLSNEKIPVWITDYVVAEYGTGALFGDAHDERDVEFAKKYKIPLKPTVITGDKDKDRRIKNLEECFTGYGTLINSGPFSGLTSKEAIKEVTEWLIKHDSGAFETTYHLRDWLISRQRYWGPPIPMIYCEKCARRIKDKGLMIKDEFSKGEMENPGWIAVKEEDLPVLLPEVKDWKPKGIHSTSSGQTVESPLASIDSFVNTKCPNCDGAAKRETDVSDTFLDSAWYFFRYACTDIESSAFDRERVKKWLPVKMYIGGAEHSVLHLLYSRFITMVLADLPAGKAGLKLVDFEEPFARFYAHGLIIKDGVKMSKSKGNVIVPDQYIAKFGADTLRMYLMFLGPFHAGGDFIDSGIEGMNRFLKRVWNLLQKSISNSQFPRLDSATRAISNEGKRMMNKTVKRVTEDVSELRYNTAIAGLMEWYNFLAKQNSVSKEEKQAFLKLLAPFAPHMTEELYQGLMINDKGLKNEKLNSIHTANWPTYDEALLREDEIKIAVSVNGKTRDIIKVPKDADQEAVEKKAMGSDNLKKYLEEKKILKTIYVPGKIINFVTG